MVGFVGAWGRTTPPRPAATHCLAVSVRVFSVLREGVGAGSRGQSSGNAWGERRGPRTGPPLPAERQRERGLTLRRPLVSAHHGLTVWCCRKERGEFSNAPPPPTLSSGPGRPHSLHSCSETQRPAIPLAIGQCWSPQVLGWVAFRLVPAHARGRCALAWCPGERVPGTPPRHGLESSSRGLGCPHPSSPTQRPPVAKCVGRSESALASGNVHRRG